MQPEPERIPSPTRIQFIHRLHQAFGFEVLIVEPEAERRAHFGFEMTEDDADFAVFVTSPKNAFQASHGEV